MLAEDSLYISSDCSLVEISYGVLILCDHAVAVRYEWTDQDEAAGFHSEAGLLVVGLPFEGGLCVVRAGVSALDDLEPLASAVLVITTGRMRVTGAEEVGIVDRYIELDPGTYNAMVYCRLDGGVAEAQVVMERQ